jgi:hypothetical protein
MDELATAYGQKWFQDLGPDVGKFGGKTPPNASQNLLQWGHRKSDESDCQSQNLGKSVSIFPRKPLNTGNEAKITNARRQERVRKCARDSGYERSVFLMRLKDGFDWGRLRGGFTLLGMASKWSPPNIRSTLWPGWSNPKHEQCNG